MMSVHGMNTIWEECTRWWPVRLIDGATGWGALMRRRVNGAWQYRNLNEAEERDRFQRMAW